MPLISFCVIYNWLSQAYKLYVFNVTHIGTFICKYTTMMKITGYNAVSKQSLFNDIILYLSHWRTEDFMWIFSKPIFKNTK